MRKSAFKHVYIIPAIFSSIINSSQSCLTNLLNKIVLIICFTSISVFAQGHTEINGKVRIRCNNCFAKDAKGEHESYFVQCSKTGKLIELSLTNDKKRKLKPGSKIRVKGKIKQSKKTKWDKFRQVLEAESISFASASSEEDESNNTTPTVSNAVAESTKLACLLIFVNTTDFTVTDSRKTTIRDHFWNNSTNVQKAMKEVTYGQYELQNGNGPSNPGEVTVSLNYAAGSKDIFALEADVINALPGLGITRANYDRLLILAPQGVTWSGKSWTAYAYNGWDLSVYSYKWSTGMLDGFIHELGHNFGFTHSNKSGEYKDVTCVMGVSHFSNKTAPFNPVKVMDKGFLSSYPGTTTTLSEDATLELKPLAKDPLNASGTRIVQFNGKEYYVSYRRQFVPYAHLWNKADRNKVIVYERTGTYYPDSEQRQNLSPGGSYTAGDVVITFEQLKDNSDTAVVSFNLADGNAKPVANNQSVNVSKNILKQIVLSASDTDNDNLTYSIFSVPKKGTLSTISGATLSYTPNSNYLGTDSFIFEVSDGKISSYATVSITVEEGVVNSAPVANDSSGSTDKGIALDLVLNASDADGNPLTFTINQPANGTVTGDGPNVTYTPNSDFTGTDSFTFKVNDSLVDSNLATVTITVNEPTPVSDSTVPLVSSTDRIAWFPLDANTNDVDANLNMTLLGAQIGSSDLKFGAGALEFAASGQSAKIADNALLNTGGPWSTRTIALWFKLDSINGRQLIIEEGGGSRGFNIYSDNGNLYVGGWDIKKDATDTETWAGTWLNLGSVSTDQWYHVALVLDASASPGNLANDAFKAYLNGSLNATGNGMQVYKHGDDFGIGAVSGSTRFHDNTNSDADFLGKMDDLAIWNRALNAEEITKLYGTTVSNETVIAESGSITIEQVNATTWFTVNLEHSFTKPVVIMSPVSSNDNDPITVRVRNVTANSFEFQIDEWEYQDGVHGTETVSWLVVEEGDHTLDDGTRIVAGSSDVSTSFSNISWDAFTSTPVALSQVVTTNDPKAVTTRQKSVSSTGFQVSLEVEEAGTGHANETVNWIAISTVSNSDIESGTTGDSIKQSWVSKNFASPKSASPVLLAAMQTTDGGDTATSRIHNLTETGFEVKIEEEKSENTEVKHTAENVGYLALAPGLIKKSSNVEGAISSDELLIENGLLYEFEVVDFDDLSLSISINFAGEPFTYFFDDKESYDSARSELEKLNESLSELIDLFSSF